MKLDKIIVSKDSFNSKEPYDIIQSNIDVINVLLEEGFAAENICRDAMISYCMDYYLAQYENGNFSQFVWNTRWAPALNNDIKIGFEKIGALNHLNLFLRLSDKVNSLPTQELISFLDSDYFGKNETRDKLKDDSFYEIKEDLVGLNAKWLKSHPKLEVLSTDDMYLVLEEAVGHKIERK